MTNHKLFLSTYRLFADARFLIPILIVAFVLGCNRKPDEPPNELAQYQSGLSAYKQKNYSAALNIFNQQLQQFPDGQYADNAYLFRGRSFYWQKNYPQSITDFLSVLNISNSDVIDSGQYWLAKAQHASGNLIQARLEYNKVDRNGIWFDNSRFQIGRSYFDESLRYDDARQELDTLSIAISKISAMIATYPASSAINAAKYYLGRCYHNQYRLVIKDPNLSLNNDPNSPQSFSEYFAAARNAYGSVVANTSYTDDARFFDIRLTQEAPPSNYNAEFYNLLRSSYQSFISNYPSSSRIDDAQYQMGKTYYDQANDLLAENQAIVAIETFDLANIQFSLLLSNSEVSGLADAASYYQGRSFHEQALLLSANKNLPSSANADSLFESARQSYTNVENLDGNSSWIDNALNQQASTYYSQAKVSLALAQQAIISTTSSASIQSLFDTAQFNLDKAIGVFKRILSDPIYSISSSADNAQYYSGRAYANAAAIPSNYRTDFSPNGINFFDINYQHAVDQFTPLTSDVIYASSIWVDNAYYEIANAQTQLALLATDSVAAKNLFEISLGNYEIVINQYPSSIRFDNAAFRIANIYHLTGYCQLEQDWLTFTLKTLSTNSKIVNESNLHLTDLSAALVSPTINHPCVSGNNPGIPQPTPPAPSGNPELLVYQTNLALYRGAMFNEAITQFKLQLSNFPSGDYADEANLYIGRAYYALVDFNQSLVYFSKVINNFPTSTNIDEAHYRSGRAEHNNAMFDLARAHYNNVATTSSWRDNAIYNIAKSHYDESKLLTDPSQRLAKVQLAGELFNTFIQNYINSTNIDNAVYFYGRHYHRMANLFIDNTSLITTISVAQAFTLAQNQYNSIPVTSCYADDATYQLSRIQYDGIKLLILPNEQFAALKEAEQRFLQFQNDSNLINSNVAHSAIYFIGRSRHKIAELLYNDNTLDPTLTPAIIMANARDAYTLAINKDISGVYADNAQYQLGRSYYSEANYISAANEVYLAYENSISFLNSFEGNGANSLSTLAHNALYFIGRNRHEQISLLLADPALSNTMTELDVRNAANVAYMAAIVNNAVGQYADNANYYLGRIAYNQATLLNTAAEQFSAYEQAIGYFSLFDTGGIYQGFGFSHSGLYYLGLSLDAEYILVLADRTLSPKTAATLRSDARLAYESSLSANPIGIYADNIAYQIGRNYYDNARVLSLAADTFLEYSNAISSLSDFSTGGLYETSFYAQRGRYFLAQSWYNQALLLQNNPNLSGMTSAQAFINAQGFYADAISVIPAGNYADNAQFQLGKSYYDHARIITDGINRTSNYNKAIVAFSAFEATGIHAQSIYNDQAIFYSGRSSHQQAQLLHTDPTLLVATVEQTMDTARLQYLTAFNLSPNGSYADNAQFQIGVTHYNQAIWAQELAEQGILNGLLTQDIDILYTDMQFKLNSAINIFSSVIRDFALANSADNSQFFLARSYHSSLDVPDQFSVDLSATIPAGIDFTRIDHLFVRAQYAPLFNPTTYPNSNWIDNAYYETGRSYSEEALIEPNIVLKVDLYNNALMNYNTLPVNYPSSVRFDNSVFSIAMVYHFTGHCVSENNWLNSLMMINKLEPQLLIDANTHIPDLQNALITPTLEHSCDNTGFENITQLPLP